MLGFYFDATRCTGCRTCQIACKDKNRLEVGTLYREVKTYSVGTYPNAKVFHFSGSCNHCENPACVAACASGAMYKTNDGAVLCDTELCDGCGNCVAACPYGAPKMLDSGVAGKCDSCYALRKVGGNTACVDACLARALDFGEMDELKAKHPGEFVSSVPAWPDGQTQPNILIKTKEQCLSEDFKIMII